MEHLTTVLPQSVIAQGRWLAKALGDSLTLLAHPAHSRPSSHRIGLESFGQGGTSAKTLGQHVSILHCHAATLAHHRGTRVRGIADQNHAAVRPLIERDPIDRPAMYLLVAIEGGEILLYDPAKTGEAAPQAIEPAGHRLVSARHCNVAKAIGAPVAYRAQPRKSSPRRAETAVY
jgi:hypothetical protein